MERGRERVTIPFPETRARLLLGVDCPRQCGGKLQTYEVVGEPIKVSCYNCGERVNFKTLRMIYEREA